MRRAALLCPPDRGFSSTSGLDEKQQQQQQQRSLLHPVPSVCPDTQQRTDAASGLSQRWSFISLYSPAAPHKSPPRCCCCCCRCCVIVCVRGRDMWAHPVAVLDSVKSYGGQNSLAPLHVENNRAEDLMISRKRLFNRLPLSVPTSFKTVDVIRTFQVSSENKKITVAKIHTSRGILHSRSEFWDLSQNSKDVWTHFSCKSPQGRIIIINNKL